MVIAHAFINLHTQNKLSVILQRNFGVGMKVDVPQIYAVVRAYDPEIYRGSTYSNGFDVPAWQCESTWEMVTPCREQPG